MELKNDRTRATHRLLTKLVGISLIFFGAAAQAATFNVSYAGADSATCGPPSNHCRTIAQALGLAVANDTILVHPGNYPEELDINKSGIQLISTNGRWATRLTAATFGNSVLTISASGVRFGSQSQGFTIRVFGGFGVRAANILSSATNTKFEGNYLYGDGDGLNADAPVRLQARHNLIDVTDYAIMCDTCAAPVITDNSIDGRDSNSDVVLVTGSGIVYRRNLLRGAGNSGVRITGALLVEDNAVYSSNSDPFTVAFPDGVAGKFEGNIAGFGNGAWAVNTSGNAANVRHNLAVGGSGEIGFFGDARRYLNNTAVGHFQGFVVDGGSINRFVGNSAYGGAEIWGNANSVENLDPMSPINAKAHFKHDDDIAVGVTATLRNSPAKTQTQEAAALQ